MTFPLAVVWYVLTNAGDDPSIQPPVDGVFRAVPHGVPCDASHVAQAGNGLWVASLNLSGELYQAHFDNKDDAYEAFRASGSG